MYTIIHEYPRCLGNPRVLMPRPFVQLLDGAPKLRKNIVGLCTRLMSGQTKREAYPDPKLIWVLPQGGSAQTPHDHVVPGVVLWVLDGHILKDLTIGPHNIVRLGPHLSPLFNHLPRSLISIPRSTSREKVCGNVLKYHRCQPHCNLLVQSPSARSLQVHVEVSCKNKLCSHSHSIIATSTYRIIVLSNGAR